MHHKCVPKRANGASSFIRSLKSLTAASGLMFAAAATAQADPVTTYTSRSAWQAATTSVVNRDFNSLPGEQNGENGLTVAGVTFSADHPLGYLYSLGPVSCGFACQWGPNLGSGNYLLGPDWPGSIYTSLQAPTSALGVDLALINSAAPVGSFPNEVNVTVNFSTGPSVTYMVSLGDVYQLNFFGVTALTSTITGLTISPANLYPQYYCDPNVCYNGLGGPNVIIDNFATGESLSAVPEPATWAMMLLGFGVIGWTLRRRITGSNQRSREERVF